MAEVYRAVDCVLHRTVAFKILSQQGNADPSMRQRFLAEARLGSQVAHPNIVRTLDYSEDGSTPYLVLEFLRGRSLARVIKENSIATMEEKVRIALESARALEHVHSLGIVHRDIKPDNIHIDDSGTARLIDFGIAKAEQLNMTLPGMVIGTPYYMPPEQVCGEQASVRTDVYSFGLVLYELFTGVRARNGDTMQRLMEEILHKPVTFELLDQAGVPVALRAIIARCAAQKPEERPESFTWVVEELKRFQQGLQDPIRPQAASATVASPVVADAAASHRTRLAWGFGIAAVLIAAVAGGAGVAGLGVSIVDRSKVAEASESPIAGDTVRLPSGLRIDRSEVTNEAFRRFVKSGNGRQLPPGFDTDSPGRPAVNVTATDADAYCKWLGKRLPTEAEWLEAAAGGPERTSYPWGNQDDPTLANVFDNPEMPKHHLVSADSMREGASKLGVLHLTGNAAEWVADRRNPSLMAIEGFGNLLQPAPSETEEWRVIKGGSFKRPLREGKVLEWNPAPARYFADDLGFRCVAGGRN